MTYIVNRHLGARITINGVDRTSNLESIQLSDSSVRGGGLIATSGTVALRQSLGAPSIADYEKTDFLRGQVIVVDIKKPDGSYVRHPRGYLYIIQSSYNPEDNKVEIEVGCLIYLASISDDITNLIGYTSLTIPDDQKNYSTLNDALKTECKLIYQNNQGSIVSGTFFEGDGYNTISNGEWLSIFGVTTLGVTSLGSSSVVPDKIELTYNTTDPNSSSTDPPKVDTVVTDSSYFLVYPASIWERARPTGGLTGVTGTTTTNTTTTTRTSDACGTSPVTPPPDPAPTTSCSEGYQSEATKQATAVTSHEENITYYNGPGNAISRAESTKYGPAVELNSSYYQDLYGFCVWGYSTQCNPSGNCPLVGLDTVKQSYQITTYEYGQAGEVTKQVQDSYKDRLAAAKQIDWRAGLKQTGGVLEYSSFDAITTGTFYLSQRVTTSYEYYENSTVETTVTQTSPADGSEGVGIRAGVSIDATAGPSTSVRRISSTTGGPPAPNSSVGGTTGLSVSKTIEDIRPYVKYVDPPTETNPVTLQAQIQLTLTANAETIASNYIYYYRKLLEAESTGLRIIEGLRDDIVSNWRPGKPFRYWDPREEQMYALRMDACSWAMDADECIVSTDAMMIGATTGTVSSMPSNVVGNEHRPTLSTPIAYFQGSISGNTLTVTSLLGGQIPLYGIISVDGVPSGVYITSFVSGTGGTGTYTISQSVSAISSATIYVYSTITPGQTIPTITGDTGLANGSFSILITVSFYFRSLFSTGGGDNGYGIITPPPTDNVQNFQTYVTFVSGALFGPGSLIAADSTGGVPISNGSVLLSTNPTIVDSDLFA